ncbi:protein of unknown function [Actinopolyspora xinjiangensis]|uniref:DUF4190 domain-containing protein n=2 Tax=Actinopolyspora xinjiangensis TaxID=405564 RepID=A0A1H0UC61_9ACTN|nr:protein of unknown function [Actinopolyspora xinjiangensis]
MDNSHDTPWNANQEHYQGDYQQGNAGFPRNMPPPPQQGMPQQGMPQQGAPMYGYMVPYRPTHPLAITSLILSLAGMFCVLPAIGGVITGHMARNRLREDQRYEGWGITLAGLILGWIITGALVAYVMALISMIALIPAGSV